MKSTLFFLAVLILVSGCALKQVENVSKKNCGKNYCTYTVGENPQKSLVYFPGLLDSKKALEKSIFDTSDIDAIVQEMSPVQVVVYSESKIPDKLAWFVKGPQRINDIILKAPEPRYGVGISMGGYNLATYSAFNPEAFKKIALVNPMLLTADESPFKTITGPAMLLKGHYQPMEWKKLNPHSLIANVNSFPSTFISSCKKDLFNLTPGAISLYGLLKLKGFDAKYKEDDLNCKHTDIPSLRILEFFK